MNRAASFVVLRVITGVVTALRKRKILSAESSKERSFQFANYVCIYVFVCMYIRTKMYVRMYV